ncbi:MAG: RraA family protein [Acidobacteriota bacterium]|nr:MAG: RraA family protein [Acidobacteriota bacterium]
MKEGLKSQSTRRDFLKTSAVAAAAAGAHSTVQASAATGQPAPTSSKDPYALAARFNKFLRVTDVVDGLDAVGRADLTLMDPSIRPLWMGMRFFGPAVTMRAVPTNRRMPLVSREDALKQHSIWGEMGGWKVQVEPHLKQGCVIAMSTGGAKECGYWGSNNSLDMMSRGVAGIVTEGNCRDTDEVILQECNVACAGIGRPIIPGRIELVDVEVPIGCGGVLVRPGDIVGCDWDGCIVVPIEVAEDVLAIAARIAIDDKKSRRRRWERLGRTPDETMDWEAAAEFFKDLL